MAVIKAVNSKADISTAINYVSKEEKTEEKLISGKDCNPQTAIDEMKAVKEEWNKTKGRQYKHYIQSFAPKDNVSPEKAHKIGLEFAEQAKKFNGHQVLIATHKDKEHIHNHFIVNSVNFENGRKYQESTKDLENLKKQSDRICEREGLSIIKEKTQSIAAFNQKKYRAIEQGVSGTKNSYLLDTAKDVSQSLKTATSKEQFIQQMKEKGYEVNWSDNRKHITYTTPEGKKVRASNLEKTFKEQKFSKEGMLNEIQRNREQSRTGDRSNELLFNRGTSESNQSRANLAQQPHEQNNAGTSTTAKSDRGEQKPRNRESQQNSKGLTSRSQRTQGRQSSKIGEPTQAAIEGNREQQHKQQTNDKSPTRPRSSNQEHTKTKLDRSSKTVQRSSHNLIRSNIRYSGRLPTSNPFASLLKELGSSIQKAESKEAMEARLELDKFVHQESHRKHIEENQKRHLQNQKSNELER